MAASTWRTEDADAQWRRYRQALRDEPLPAAIVDLDAVDENARRLRACVEGSGKTLRVCTKSLRCPELARYVLARGGDLFRGVMTFTAAETAYLAAAGFGDLLLAYPTVHPADARALALTNASGATAAVVVDDAEQQEPLTRAARAQGTSIPVVVEVDVSYRPLGSLVHLGVRRSPLRSPADVVALAQGLSRYEGLRFHGVMAYEAHVAGLPDRSPYSPWSNLPKRAMKRLAKSDIESRRAQVVAALRDAGLAPAIVNGGGSGSLRDSAHDPALTEVAAGSGFVGSHLFDYFADLDVVPAAFFALQVVRRPGPGYVACHGGGFVASGAAGRDKLPIPWLPAGLALLGAEGAGEVMTPLEVPRGLALSLGDPVFFRHAKAGELAEHVREYLFIRGDRIESRAPTYRGLGQCFLG